MHPSCTYRFRYWTNRYGRSARSTSCIATRLRLWSPTRADSFNTSTRVQLLCGKTLESTRCVANYYIAILIAVLRVLLVIGKCSLISMARFSNSERKQKANRQQYYSANRNKVSREMKCYYERTADVGKRLTPLIQSLRGGR